MHHFFTDNDNGLPPVFYELLMESMKRRAPYRATLRGTLALLLQLLNEPLHPCEGCQSQFDDFAEVNRKRLNTIALYAPQRPARSSSCRRAARRRRADRGTPRRRRRLGAVADAAAAALAAASRASGAAARCSRVCGRRVLV